MTLYYLVMIKQERLATWLVEQCEARGWSWNEACRKAGVAENTISKIVNGQGRAGVKACRSFAKLFGIPVRTAFEMAGIEYDSISAQDQLIPELAGLMDMAAQWPTDLQKILWRAWASNLDAISRASGYEMLDLHLPPSTPEFIAELRETIRLTRLARKLLGSETYMTYIGTVAGRMRDLGFTESDIKAMKKIAFEETDDTE